MLKKFLMTAFSYYWNGVSVWTSFMAALVLFNWKIECCEWSYVVTSVDLASATTFEAKIRRKECRGRRHFGVAMLKLHILMKTFEALLLVKPAKDLQTSVTVYMLFNKPKLGIRLCFKIIIIKEMHRGCFKTDPMYAHVKSLVKVMLSQWSILTTLVPSE